MRLGLNLPTLTAATIACVAANGCVHTSHIAVMSDGNLAGRSLWRLPRGPVLTGKDCGMKYFLSKAFRRALRRTGYDTLVNVRVRTTTGALIWNNCVRVTGTGIHSQDLPMVGTRGPQPPATHPPPGSPPATQPPPGNPPATQPPPGPNIPPPAPRPPAGEGRPVAQAGGGS